MLRIKENYWETLNVIKIITIVTKTTVYKYLRVIISSKLTLEGNDT
jgi:hypothetical protein